MPATPTALSITSQWLAWRVNGAISNKGAVALAFTSGEAGQHRLQAVLAGVVLAEVVTGDAVRTARLFGLPINTTPTLQVRSENAGLSAWKTAACTVPIRPVTAGDIPVPTALAVGVTDPARAVITWTDNANNESGYKVTIRGPEGVVIYAFAEPDAASIILPVLPISYPGQSYLLFASTYIVQISALGGKFTTRGFTPLETALSAEVTFATAPAQIVITNLPARAAAWQGLAFSFTLATSETPTSFSLSSGALPTGLTLNTSTGVVSGTPTAAAGTYTAALRANNAGGHDIATLTIQLAVTGFSIRLTDGSLLSSLPANLGVALNFQLLAVPFGPLAAVTTWTLTEGPDWLSFSGDRLVGTPTASGVYLCALTASNGTQSVAWTFTVVVAGVRFTTADNLTVFAAAAFSFPLAAAPAGCTFTSGDLPAGVALAGNLLAGAVAAAGDYDLDIGAHLGSEGATQSFTLHVKSLATFDAEWDMIEGEPQLEVLTYNGAGLVNQWFLSSAPPGLTIDFATPLTGPSSETRKAKVTGAPTATGIFDAEVTAEVTLAGVTTLHRFPVLIIVSGGLFLGWYHADAARREAQILLRSLEVAGYYFDATAGLGLVRADPTTLHVILRDAPIHAAELGLRTVESGLTDLKLMVRPAADYDAEPWIEVGGAVVTAAIGTHTVFALTFTPGGDEIEQRFAALNANPGADPTEAKLTGVGEFTGTLNGVVFTTKPFVVTIRQDIDR